MTAEELVQRLEARGARLLGIEGRLKVIAPLGSLTHDQRNNLTELKFEILEILKQQPAGACACEPGSDLAGRPIAIRRAEALELLGELNYLFDERAAIMEALGGFPREEAERLAMKDIKSSETFRRWQALG